VALSVDRVAWQFGDDAAHAIVRSRSAAAGEFQIHVDGCNGPLLATMPLATAASSASETQSGAQLSADIATAPRVGARDVCVIATGDPRDGQWALARMEFSRGDTR
jgi:hexosaminidase